MVSSVEQILKVTCNPFLLPFSPLENEKAKFSMPQSLSQMGLRSCVVGGARLDIRGDKVDIPERLHLPKQKTIPLWRKHFLFLLGPIHSSRWNKIAAIGRTAANLWPGGGKYGEEIQWATGGGRKHRRRLDPWGLWASAQVLGGPPQTPWDK